MNICIYWNFIRRNAVHANLLDTFFSRMDYYICHWNKCYKQTKNNKWDNRYIETYKEGKRRTKRQMIKCLRVEIQLCSNYTPSLWNKLCENAAYFMWAIDKNDNESSLKCLLFHSNANIAPHFVRHQFKSKHNFKHRTPFS